MSPPSSVLSAIRLTGKTGKMADRDIRRARKRNNESAEARGTFASMKVIFIMFLNLHFLISEKLSRWV